MTGAAQHALFSTSGRTLTLEETIVLRVARRGREHISTHGIKRDELLFSTQVGTAISRNTFRSRVWLPAVAASGIDFRVRIHDLRHAQIQTTQKYLHTLPDTHQKNLDALTRIAGAGSSSSRMA